MATFWCLKFIEKQHVLAVDLIEARLPLPGFAVKQRKACAHEYAQCRHITHATAVCFHNPHEWSKWSSLTTRQPCYKHIHSLLWHAQNVTIPCHCQELLPFLSVMHFFLPPFSTNYSSILSHLILPSISWSTSQSSCSQIHIQGLSKRFEHLVLWPPRSPDLTPCDFFLWGYVKDNAYKPQTARSPSSCGANH